MGRRGRKTYDLATNGLGHRSILILRVAHQEFGTSHEMPKREQLGEIGLSR